MWVPQDQDLDTPIQNEGNQMLDLCIRIQDLGTRNHGFEYPNQDLGSQINDLDLQFQDLGTHVYDLGTQI